MNTIKHHRSKVSPEVLKRQRLLCEEALAIKGLTHRPLVELFSLKRGVSHSGGIPAFSNEAWLLAMDYNLRSGQSLDSDAENQIQSMISEVKGV
jgi:hypothetical protein